jgi:DNA phosphorothioation-associated putative methyltransferase
MEAEGKQIGSRTYVHVSLLDDIRADVRRSVLRAIELATLRPGIDFHVARFDRERGEVALLSYPTFFEDPFPSLNASWSVHLASGAVRFRDYAQSLNPPILHRKELMIPRTHDAWGRLNAQTRIAEELGLFADPSRIGFRNQWLALLASKGYEVIGSELRPVGNDEVAVVESSATGEPAASVSRHLTALSRKFLSAPVQTLLRNQLLDESMSFFDYGCGKGDDVAGLRTLSIHSNGWDPYYAADLPVIRADIVNLGFVINVIEDLEERITALQRAFSLASRALCVSAMLSSNASLRGRRYRDGILTTRNTFQKYYEQHELQNFIELVLDEQAIPAGPGIFLVFRDPMLEQKFLLRRHTDATRAPRLLAIREKRISKPSAHIVPAAKEETPERSRLVRLLWTRALELGRAPEEDEVPEAPLLTAEFGSWRRSLQFMASKFDERELEAAATQKRDELRVMFALEAFGRKQPFRAFSAGLQRDIKTFFGSLLVAQTEGRRLLLECADPSAIELAARRAAESGIGYLDGEHSLQLHTSLASRLPPLLKAYVGCATALYGDLSSADLVKIHLASGKVTLMRFDDFGRLLPRMVERVKVRLRDQDFDVFSYGGDFPSPFLYFKSRYINEEFEDYADQLEFDQLLEELNMPLGNGHGLSPEEFSVWLASERLELGARGVVPASTIPDLDQKCGAWLTYRQLCECGETWERLRPENVPRRPETYNALRTLTRKVLDPVIDYFGAVKLTYGFASSMLTKCISRAIAPKLDQHAACEVSRNGFPVCDRLGAAVDFLIEFENMREVAGWVADHCDFDRLYFYGEDRPIHVSVGPNAAREIYHVVEKSGRRIPRRLTRVGDSA